LDPELAFDISQHVDALFTFSADKELNEKSEGSCPQSKSPIDFFGTKVIDFFVE
jgi:hypothetical protein